jgi:hypothetical protein
MAILTNDSIGVGGGSSAFVGGGAPFGGFGGGAPFSVPFSVPFPVPSGGFGPGYGGCGGMGIEALVLLALFGGRGFGREGGHHDHCRDGGDGGNSTAALAAVIAALNDRDNSSNCEAAVTAVLAKLGNIEGQIPAVSCELQMALQGAVASLTAQGNANAASLTSQLNALQLGQLVQSNAIQTAIANVDTNVDRQACETRGAIAASESRIIALITANQIADLNTKIINLANENAELRSDARHADHRREVEGLRITIENNNTAVAAQAQAQQQLQAQLQFQQTRFDNERILSHVNGLSLQFAKATNSSINVGNTGAIGTTQNANPTNVNAL